eukprot:2219767-Rhodomonas_salina.1
MTPHSLAGRVMLRFMPAPPPSVVERILSFLPTYRSPPSKPTCSVLQGQCSRSGDAKTYAWTEGRGRSDALEAFTSAPRQRTHPGGLSRTLDAQLAARTADALLFRGDFLLLVRFPRPL